MADIIPLTVTSIKIVEPELNISLQDAARHFEAFMTDRNLLEQLNESRACMADVAGVLKLLAIPGALQLAQEMLALIDVIVAQPYKASDFALSALSQAFVAMPCYIEYIVDREQAVPALTLGFINELRSARRQPTVLESTLANYPLLNTVELASDAEPSSDLSSMASRLRQMYQVGLIGLLREDNLQLKIQLMHRAMHRLAVASGSTAVRGQWLLAEAVLEALLSKDLSLNFTRKRILSLLDAELRKLEQSPTAGDLTADTALLTELAYLVQLSQCSHPASEEVRARLSLQALALSDKALQQERHIMQGPNADTINMMVTALREELAQSKEQLEVAAQDSNGSVDFSQMAEVFNRTADILAVTGLTSPSRVLRTMRDTVKNWASQNQCDKDQLLEVADGLLYVESALTNLNRFDLNFEAQQENDAAKRALMAKSQLNEAERIVIQEAQVGIAQAKKDINSFVESQYDKSHFESVLEALTGVRGAAIVLGYTRAAAVLASCVKFIQASSQEAMTEENANNILETMADALIALEYYLSEIELHGEAPANVLQVAEQSLAALGFPVAAH